MAAPSARGPAGAAHAAHSQLFNLLYGVSSGKAGKEGFTLPVKLKRNGENYLEHIHQIVVPNGENYLGHIHQIVVSNRENSQILQILDVRTQVLEIIVAKTDKTINQFLVGS
jgi:hypothetical protein